MDATKLHSRARDWIEATRDTALLLRGAALSAAERWKNRKPRTDQIVGVTLDFLLTSRQRSIQRQRYWITGSLAVAAGAAAEAIKPFQHDDHPEVRDWAALFLRELTEHFVGRREGRELRFDPTNPFDQTMPLVVAGYAQLLVPGLGCFRATLSPLWFESVMGRMMVCTRADDLRFDCPRSPTKQLVRMAWDNPSQVTAMDHHAVSGWPTATLAPGFMPKGLNGVPYDLFEIHGADHWYTVGAQRVRALQNDLFDRNLRPGFLRSVGAGFTNWALESFALLGYGPAGTAGAGGAPSTAGAST